MSEYKEKYPWLRLQNLYTGKLYETRDAVDEMKEFAPGWFIAFGEMMLDELNAAIEEADVVDTFIVGQIKEKFGQLKIHHNQPKNSEIENIVRKYELISAHVCIECGAVDVPMLHAAWIRPMCRDCYAKDTDRNHCDYDSVASEETKIPDERIWKTFDHMDEVAKKAVYQTHTEDISATVRRIRQEYAWKQKEQKFQELLKKYPWSKSRGWDEEPGEQPYCMLEDIPDGWWEAFGEMMFEELDAALKAHNLVDEFYFEQIKEKYGALRMYASPGVPEISNILDKYEVLSENICIMCGAVDVPNIAIGGWVSPYCKNCYTKITSRRKALGTKPFEELAAMKDCTMASELSIRTYKPNEGHERKTMDLRPTADKIRERYQQRQKDSE